MRKLRASYRPAAVVPTASMADIAFLLIIFFMLTTSFSPVKMSVDMAESVSWEEVAKDAAIIAIDPRGNIEVSNGISTGTVINTGPGGVAGGQTTATQAIDTGIILRVTPFITTHNMVEMIVQPEISSISETEQVEIQDGRILRADPAEIVGYVAVPFWKWGENSPYA